MSLLFPPDQFGKLLHKVSLFLAKVLSRKEDGRALRNKSWVTKNYNWMGAKELYHTFQQV